MKNDFLNLTPPDLFHQGMLCHHGAVEHPEILLAQNSADRILIDLGAAEKLFGEHALEDAKLPILNGAMATVLADAYGYAQGVKGAFVKRYGPSHNANWTALGFKGSLEVPRSENDLRALITSFSTFLGKNKPLEIATLDVTEAKADKWVAAIDEARKTITTQERVVRDQMDLRDGAMQALCVRLRGLTTELIQLIGREDKRWEDFGLNVPAAPESPGQPQNVAVNTDTPEQMLITCDREPYADSYRLYQQGVGSELPPVLVTSSREPIFLMKNAPGGEKLNLFLSAVNKKGSEGPRSAAVVAQVQARRAAA